MSTPTEFHIGIDDTDSQSRGCTTHTAAVLFQKICDTGIEPSDFPWLVRLNPNIPWKTRGNGAIAIHLKIDESQIETVQRLALKTTRDTADLSSKKTDPAVVFLRGPVPNVLREFSNSALHDVLSIGQARRVAKECKAETYLLKGTRGLIGSLAAIGADLNSRNHTFEIIAYRTNENLGTPRRVDKESIRSMNSRHSNQTFHNLDPESGRLLVCPHGPDPVLLGIRGTTPQGVENAFSDVHIEEQVERVMIFRTNQGTDAHLTKARLVIDLAPFQSAVLTGRVDNLPRILRGGHVVFQLSDHTGRIDCAAYAPTRSLMSAARELLPGDRVRVYGGIRIHLNGQLTINLEKIQMLELIPSFARENPACPSCSGRCESMGRGQGLRCKKCGARENKLTPVRVLNKRKLEPITYTAVVGARRHLSRPHIRAVGIVPS